MRRRFWILPALLAVLLVVIAMPSVVSAHDPNGPECQNGKDDDGDGRYDFDGFHGAYEPDPECTSLTDPSESPPPACNDGVDNDSDGKIDYSSDGNDDGARGTADDGDQGCTSTSDTRENGPKPEPSCGDPDGDGRDHSTLAPDENENGPLSRPIHNNLETGGVLVPQLNCWLIAGVLGL